MKKTAISLILVLAIALSFVLMAAPNAAAAGNNHVAHTEGMDHCACGGTAAGIGDHTTCTPVTGAWVDLNAYVADPGNTSSDGKLTLVSGNYYLSANLDSSKVIRVNEENFNITICMNGYDLKGTVLEGDDSRVFYSAKAGTISFCDCQGDGSISSVGQKHGAILCMDAADINLYSGIFISSPNATGGGAGFRINGGTTKMYAAHIKDGKSTVLGGNVVVDKKTEFIMYGGSITGGESADKGGNVCVQSDGKLTIHGGIISGGTAPVGADIMAAARAQIIIVNVDETINVSITGDAVVNVENMDESVSAKKNGNDYTFSKKTGEDPTEPVVEPTDEPTQPADKPTTPSTSDNTTNEGGDNTVLIIVGVVMIVLAAVVLIYIVVSNKKKK